MTEQFSLSWIPIASNNGEADLGVMCLSNIWGKLENSMAISEFEIKRVESIISKFVESGVCQGSCPFYSCCFQ